ncbi:MAG: alpha/beta hydrolase [Acidimicrobiales bacterium]|nr:alpha/beta hydrolase [Acidimicrobiales bacterium]
MNFDVDSKRAHAATGGVEPRPGWPLVVLVHGAGMDSTVWQLQTRYLAHRGVAALAVDLPGHGFSEGPALASVAEMGAWLGRFIKTVDMGQALIVGHSMGTFVALETAASRPDLVKGLVLMGTAAAMPVHPDLLKAADNDVAAAAALMAGWSHHPGSKLGPNPNPGQAMLGAMRALVEMSPPGVLAGDLLACASYDGALEAAAAVQARATIVVGAEDKMTPGRAAGPLIEAMADTTVVVLERAGHSMMYEDPRRVSSLLLSTARGLAV